jgi:hypothetical protein
VSLIFTKLHTNKGVSLTGILLDLFRYIVIDSCTGEEARHGFNTGSDTDIDITITDLVGYCPDSLKTTATLSIDRRDATAFWQTSV